MFLSLATAVAAAVQADAYQVELQLFIFSSDTPIVVSAGDTRDDLFSIDLYDAPFLDVIKLVGEISGRNLEVPPDIIAQTVTVIGHHPIPRRQALAFLGALLETRGYMMVEDVGGNLLKIVPIGSATEKLDIVSADDAATIPGEHAILLSDNIAFIATQGDLQLAKRSVGLGGDSLDWSGGQDLRRAATASVITPSNEMATVVVESTLRATVTVSPQSQRGALELLLDWQHINTRIPLQQDAWAVAAVKRGMHLELLFFRVVPGA